jgi:hypothetical protein
MIALKIVINHGEPRVSHHATRESAVAVIQPIVSAEVYDSLKDKAVTEFTYAGKRCGLEFNVEMKEICDVTHD